MIYIKLLSLAFGNCSDIAVIEDMESICMYNLIGFYGRDEATLLSIRRRWDISSSTKFCHWKGVWCDTANVATKISWREFPRMYIDWLPPSLEVFILQSSCLLSELNCRRLPRNLRECIVNNCYLKGSVDLTSLPKVMVKLDISMNSIDGTVDLRSLPKNLKSVKIAFNQIKEVIIDEATLPECFEFQYLGLSQHTRITYVDEDIDR